MMMGHDEKVKVVRDALRTLGAQVRVNNRQLVRREKTYLHIKCRGGHHEWQAFVMPVIREHFPDAYMASGSFLTSVNRMNLTIALEK